MLIFEGTSKTGELLGRCSFWKHAEPAEPAERQRQQQPHWFRLIGQEVSPPCLGSTTMLCLKELEIVRRARPQRSGLPEYTVDLKDFEGF